MSQIIDWAVAIIMWTSTASLFMGLTVGWIARLAGHKREPAHAGSASLIKLLALVVALAIFNTVIRVGGDSGHSSGILWLLVRDCYTIDSHEHL